MYSVCLQVYAFMQPNVYCSQNRLPLSECILPFARLSEEICSCEVPHLSNVMFSLQFIANVAQGENEFDVPGVEYNLTLFKSI